MTTFKWGKGETAFLPSPFIIGGLGMGVELYMRSIID